MNNDWNRPPGQQQRPTTQTGTVRPTAQQGTTGPATGQQRPASPGDGDRTGNGEKQQAQGKKKSRKIRPTWQRVTIGIVKYASVPLVICAAIVIGLWLGYVKLGDQPASDMFRMETWKHLFDLIFADS